MMELPAHTVERSMESRLVVEVYDHGAGLLVGKYALDSASGRGAFMARSVGGWDIGKVNAAVEAALEDGL